MPEVGGGGAVLYLVNRVRFLRIFSHKQGI